MMTANSIHSVLTISLLCVSSVLGAIQVFLIPMRQLLLLCPLYGWENWGLGMLSDLTKEHILKGSGFKSSFVWIHPGPNLLMSALYILHCNTCRLQQRAMLTLFPLSVYLTGSLPCSAWLGFQGSTEPLGPAGQPLVLAAHCSGPWPVSAALHSLPLLPFCFPNQKLAC